MSGSIAFLLVSVAASGYILASKCFLNKYRIARQSGHRLYLSSLTYGVYALIPAAVITEVLSKFISLSSELTVSAILTIVIASVFTELYNRNPNPKEIFKVLLKARKQHLQDSIKELQGIFAKDEARKSQALWEAWQENDIELICAYASGEFKSIAVTLDTEKVYVGMVADTIEPSDHESYLSILPFYSGYRDSKTHIFKLNHKYSSLIDGIVNESEAIINSVLDYTIVIPLERIVTIHVFNESLYKEVSGESTEAI